jgi:ATP-dependent RNA helicase HelY
VAIDVRPPRPARANVDEKAEREAGRLERLAEAHPCHGCPERSDHERWAGRASELEHQVRGIDRRIRSRTETLARQFDRVLGVLGELGYVREFTILPKGRTLARIYGEGDVLVAEALAEGLFDGLTPSEAAAITSTIVYESRERVPTQGDMPTPLSAERYRHLTETFRRVRGAEDRHHVELCRELEAGFAVAVHRWAEGAALEDVLRETGMAPGDFVRSCKQLLDLLRQIEDVADGEPAEVVRRAREAVNRGVVAYTGV